MHWALIPLIGAHDVSDGDEGGEGDGDDGEGSGDGGEGVEQRATTR